MTDTTGHLIGRFPFMRLNFIAEEFAPLRVIICLQQALLAIYMTIFGPI